MTTFSRPLNDLHSRLKVACLVGLASMLINPVSFAQTGQGASTTEGSAKSVSSTQWPQSIRSLLDQEKGERVVRTFPAAGGLTGWVIEISKQLVMVYTTADTNTLIAGALYDEHGKNITESYMQEHFPAEYLEKLKARHQDQDSGAIEVPATRLDSLWNSFDSLFTINAYRPDETVKSTVPSGISKMYVFVDMNCIYCHMLAQTLKPYQDQGLQVSWVPVALLGQDSVSRAALVINAANPLAVINGQMDLDSYPHHPLDTKEIDNRAAQLIEANTLAMRDFGGNGTPTIVWKDKNDQVQVVPGLLLPERIAEISGIPLQPVSHPRLEELLTELKS